MGIAKEVVRFLLHQHALCPLEGPVLVLGRQHVFVTLKELTELASAAGVSLTPIPKGMPVLSDIPGWKVGVEVAYISDTALFWSLGGLSVRHLDVSGYERAEIVADLNQPLPAELTGAFRTVFDGGTLEHVFDVRTALGNIARSLSAGGHVIHITQSSNWIDHGFYQFSPVLFHDYYAANGFADAACFITEQGRGTVTRNRWRWHRWPRTGRRALVSSQHVGLCFIATKQLPGDGTTSPMQSNLRTNSGPPNRSILRLTLAHTPPSLLAAARRLYWRFQPDDLG